MKKQSRKGENKMKIRKRLIAWLLVMIMVVGIVPMNVQAADVSESYVRWLQRNMSNSGFDLDNDGINDTVNFLGTDKNYFYLTINDKKWRLPKSSIYDDNKLLLFKVANDGVYIITTSLATRTDTARTLIYRYHRKKLYKVNAIRQSRNFDIRKMLVIGSHEDKLLVRSVRSERKTGMLRSFKYTQKDVNIVIPYRFRNGTVDMYPSTVSPYFYPGRFIVGQSFRTSTTAALTDANGPIVHKNEKVEVLDFALTQKGVICKISVNGKTGWFKNSYNIKLYDYD